MKKLLILFTFLLGLAIQAQSSRIEIPFFWYDNDFDEGICENYVVLTAFFTDGTSEDFYDHPFGVGSFGDGTGSNIRPDRFYDFPGKRISRLRVHAFSREEQDVFLGNGCRSDRGTTIQHERFYDLGNDSCRRGTHDVSERNGGEFEVRHRLLLEYEISNGVDILPNGINDELGYDDDFTVRATPGFSAGSYNWQYRLSDGSVGWTNLPRPTNPSTLIFRASQQSNLDESAIGKKVQFRIERCFGHPSANIEEFTILNSAPHIRPNPSITNVNCFGADNGTVTLEFDRPLRPNEQLGFQIVDLSDQNGVNADGSPSFQPVTSFNLSAADMNGNFLEVTGLPGSNTEGFRAQFVGGNELYTDAPDHTLIFSIDEPSFVVFNPPTFTNIQCFGGEDGTITLEASGGTEGNYEFELTRPDSTIDNWVGFDNAFTHTITDLSLGEYSIRIRDGNGCVASEPVPVNGEIELGAEIEHKITIGQPTAPLQLAFEASKDASAAGFTDGSITVRIFGGTPNPDGSYNVIWKDENNIVLNTADAQVVANGYLTTLRDIGVGNYLVSVTDANYTNGTQKSGCEILDIPFSISEPPPLLVTIDETNPISCNSSNTFNDPFSDGELVARAEGGVPLGIFDNNGLPYYYTWKKEDSNGIFQLLPQETDSILGNVNVGRYSVNIEDANGIIIGQYVNNVLVTPLDVVYDLEEPDLIDIIFDKENISCSGGNEGWAEAIITGGTGSYTLRWSNGETTNRIENLESGKYLVFVIDEKGCEATGQVTIDAPESLVVETTQKRDPTCNDGTDGQITLSVSGGVAPYSYQWQDLDSLLGETEGSIREGLLAGTYTVLVTDANSCIAIHEIILENPAPNLIDLGTDRTLCGGQSVVLDATFQEEGTTYQWTSDAGFSSTSPIIEVSEAGVYTVELTTPLGCSGGDSITITTLDTEIDSHFVVSTQAFAGQELALINISSPMGDNVTWFFPSEAEIVAESDETAILLFDEPGTYDIILRSYQGECYLDFMKSVIVAEAEDIPDIGDAQDPFIQEFLIYPNPSNGNFKIDVALMEESSISLKLFSMATQGLVSQRKEAPATTFSLEYGVALSSGSYVLLLETAKGSEIRKVLIK